MKALESLRSLRALMRVEVRDLRRHRGRSALVAALIAVPVAALVGGSALVTITTQSPHEARARVMGRAAMRVEWTHGSFDDPLAAIAGTLPDFATCLVAHSGQASLAAPGRRLGATVLTIDSGDSGATPPGGLAEGMLACVRGRLPTVAGEVAISPVLLRGLDLAIGDEVRLAGASMTVSGVVVDPENLAAPVVLAAPGSVSVGTPFALIDVRPGGLHETAGELRAAGFRVTTRDQVGQPDPFVTLAIFVVGGIGFAVTALVVAAAFAVSFRRRQREIGLLGSCGGAASDIGLAFVLSAALIACLGGGAGAVVGWVVAALIHPFLDAWTGRLNGPFEVSWVHTWGALALGVLTAIAAAVAPALGAARLPIRVALSGRRPQSGSSWIWLAAGVTLLFGGGVLMLGSARGAGAESGVGVLAGAVAAVVGLCATCPWLLGRLARLASPLPIAWRLAVRDAGRFRARNGPVVAAVLAGMSFSVLLAGLVASVETLIGRRPPRLRPDQLLVDGPDAGAVIARLRRDLTVVAASPLLAVYRDGLLVRAESAPGRTLGGDGAWIACGDESLLRVFDAESAREAFLRGDLIDIAPRSGDASLPHDVGPLASAEVFVVGNEVEVRSPRFLLSLAQLDPLGLQSGPPPQATLVPWLARLDRAIHEADLRRAQDIAADEVDTAVRGAAQDRGSPRAFLRVMLMISFAAGLTVIGIATVLSSVESAADRRVLHAVGASPELVRRHVAAGAGYLALLGCLLAVPAGLIPLLGLTTSSAVPLRFEVPWTEVAVAVLGFPMLAYGATWAWAAIRPLASPR